jgi:anti-sigma B factor antagonist
MDRVLGRRPEGLALGGLFIGIAALTLLPPGDGWTAFAFTSCSFAAFVYLFDFGVISRLSDTHRSRAESETLYSKVAESLSTLADQFDALGEHEAALSAMQDALGIYRELAAARPAAFDRDIATSLANRGIRLAKMGQGDTAHKAAAEASGIYRDLASDRPASMVSVPSPQSHEVASGSAAGRDDKGLSIYAHVVDDMQVFDLIGSIDVFTAPTVRAELISASERGDHRLVVDLTRVDFLDSTGLGALIGAQRRAKEFGGEVRLVVVQDGQILRLLRITGLLKTFAVFVILEDAINDGQRVANL